MAGYTENRIVVLRDPELVFELTNRIELWPRLFTEYERAEVLESDGREVRFRLTTFADGKRPSRSWVSRRVIDRARWRADAERLESGVPFSSMKITWLYEPLPGDVGVVMTWIQEFEVHPDCPWSTEQMESFLNRNTRVQMRSVKEKVEAWPASAEGRAQP